MTRKIVAYKSYFLDFYENQDDDLQQKIEWTLGLIRDLSVIPEKFFKHVEGTKGLYEVRIQAGSNICRIFAFFDEGNVVVLANAYRKKSKRLPKRILVLAIKIMEEYCNEKE